MSGWSQNGHRVHAVLFRPTHNRSARLHVACTDAVHNATRRRNSPSAAVAACEVRAAGWLQGELLGVPPVCSHHLRGIATLGNACCYRSCSMYCVLLCPQAWLATQAHREVAGQPLQVSQPAPPVTRCQAGCTCRPPHYACATLLASPLRWLNILDDLLRQQAGGPSFLGLHLQMHPLPALFADIDGHTRHVLLPRGLCPAAAADHRTMCCRVQLEDRQMTSEWPAEEGAGPQAA